MANVQAITRQLIQQGGYVVDEDTKARRAEMDGRLDSIVREAWQDREEQRMYLAGMMNVIMLLGQEECEIPKDVYDWAHSLSLWQPTTYWASRGVEYTAPEVSAEESEG